jgi:hypothetical protein
MRLDSTVARRKFDTEVETVRREAKLLQSWGCLITDTTYPNIDVVFLPRQPLIVSTPVPPPREVLIADPGQNYLQGVLRYDIAGRAFGVRIGLDDFDQRAPSVALRDPWTWQPLAKEHVFGAHHVDQHGKAMSVLLQDHPTTHDFFLCLRGTREYHEHPQHSGDDWLLHRQSCGIFSLLTAIRQACIEQAVPNLVVSPVVTQPQSILQLRQPLPPQVGFKIDLVWQANRGTP